MNGWDPARRLQGGAPRDTYENLVDELLGVLTREPDKDEISEFLERKIDETFRVKPEGTDAFANKLLVWSQLSASLG